MGKAYLGLGTNLGDRSGNLETACMSIYREAGRLADRSPIYESDPWGFSSDRKFLNMVIAIDTDLNPARLLNTLKSIETSMGRIHDNIRYSSRIIDIDILFYDDRLISTTDLIIPHPLLHERQFVLVPLAEIAGNLVHPALGKTISMLLEECRDNSFVKLI